MEAPYRHKTVYRHQPNGSTLLAYINASPSTISTTFKYPPPFRTPPFTYPHRTFAMLSRQLNTRPRSNGSLHSLIIVFAQITTLVGSAFLPHVLIRDYAYSDSAGVSTRKGRPSLPHGLAGRNSSSSSPKRQHTFDLLLDPYEVLDIRPVHVDTDDVSKIDPDPKGSKRADVQSMKLRPKFKSMPPPPYSLVDICPLPAYTP